VRLPTGGGQSPHSKQFTGASEMSEWISVDDRLPVKGSDIWIFREYVPSNMPVVDRIQFVNTNDDDSWFSHWGITYWQPCVKPEKPEPPK